ncbi:hypothetical protein BT63DRAFT_369836 [Microthyrium microscopicum]|uniref:RING-type domain-containing protein n=1 Tax=Microthyrium microscopicum TaxID=703497 RepID=A0A6A6UJ96_9PEZI|nr:hypothetical protein BT63DRAFT_369836 [Microthyrium microscopicum]
MSSIYNFLRGITTFSSYIISKWALAAALMAFTLGRVHVFASSRVPLHFNFFTRAALYSVPIALLATQALQVLQAIRCQTSPDWADLRYHNSSKQYSLDFAGEAGWLHHLSSSVLYWETDKTSCQSVGMAGLKKSDMPRGSLSILWPLFLGLCGSQFVETFSAALQGRQPITENSIFEMSLAFAEAEALVVKPFEVSLLSGKTEALENLPMKISMVKKIMNASPEVLLLALIFAMSTVTSNVLAIFNKRKKWRLVNTGIWGTAYMVAFIWNLKRMVLSDEEDWNFRFPTVFVVGFIPHLVIILGTFICATIYAMALLMTAIAPPAGQGERRTIRERVYDAYHNLQANVYLAAGETVRFSWEDEFYSTLLKAGFMILTVASEAVYLTQGTNIRVSNLTWLEQGRVNEIKKHRGLLFKKTQAALPNSLKRNATNTFMSSDDLDHNASGTRTGYAVERKARARKHTTVDLNDTQSERRVLLAVKFIKGIFWLCVSAFAMVVLFICESLGMRSRPAWVRKLVGSTTKKRSRAEKSPQKSLDFWILKEDGTFHLARDASVDVEAEMRKQAARTTGSSRATASRLSEARETQIDEKLYDWWKLGGWWGEADTSGDYQDSQDHDDDLTSVISMSSNADPQDDWTDEDETSGQRTPTQDEPFPSRSRGRNDLVDPDALAALLDPQTTEQQQEARMLAHRLRAPAVLTRSQYTQNILRDRASVLTSTRSFNPERKILDRDEEERQLERFILDQRQNVASRQSQHPQTTTTGGTEDWSAGAPGMGNSGPMCVVCQDAPRTILLWPCGCLTICDECRVSMATRNYVNCVCCRTQTEAFSRLFVP